MTRLGNAWQRWVALWDRRESPLTLALLRILFTATLLADQLEVVHLGLPATLWAPAQGGGLGDPLGAVSVPWLYQILPPTAEAVTIAFWVWVAATLMFAFGLLTRLSGAVVLLLYAQFALALPGADRGIDMLIRNVLLVLLFSQSHATCSLDARIRTGRWRGEGRPVPAWPRHLLILQLVVVYFTAGIQKVALSWMPMGGFTALYIVLHDPAVARQGLTMLDTFFPLTQIATASTVTWEWSAPLLLAAIWFRDTRTRGGRLRATLNRLDFRTLWLLVGVLFHVGIHLTMKIGIFPWTMMALYVCAYHPDELHAFGRRLRPKPRS